MKTVFGMSLPAWCALSSSALAACSAQPADDSECEECQPIETEQILDASETRHSSIAWTGEDLVIRGLVREIRLEASDDDELHVEWTPQARLPFGSTQRRADREAEELETILQSEEGNIEVMVSGESKLSARVVIALPEEFSGVVDIEKGRDLHGTFIADFVAEAEALLFETESTGGVEIHDTGTLRDVFVLCRGPVITERWSGRVLNQVHLDTDLGEIVTGFARAPSLDTTVRSRSGGDVEVLLYDAPAVLLAARGESGVDIEGLPRDCERDEADSAAVELRCGEQEVDEMGQIQVESSRKVRVSFQ